MGQFFKRVWLWYCTHFRQIKNIRIFWRKEHLWQSCLTLSSWIYGWNQWWYLYRCHLPDEFTYLEEIWVFCNIHATQYWHVDCWKIILWFRSFSDLQAPTFCHFLWSNLVVERHSVCPVCNETISPSKMSWYTFSWSLGKFQKLWTWSLVWLVGHIFGLTYWSLSKNVLPAKWSKYIIDRPRNFWNAFWSQIGLGQSFGQTSLWNYPVLEGWILSWF